MKCVLGKVFTTSHVLMFLYDLEENAIDKICSHVWALLHRVLYACPWSV